MRIGADVRVHDAEMDGSFPHLSPSHAQLMESEQVGSESKVGGKVRILKLDKLLQGLEAVVQNFRLLPHEF